MTSAIDGYRLDEPLPSAPPRYRQLNYKCFAVGAAQQVLVHGNGLAVVGLAPSHPALQALAGSGVPAQLGSAAETQQTNRQETEPEQPGQVEALPMQTGREDDAPAAAASMHSRRQETGLAASASFDAGRQNLLQVKMRKGRGPLLAPDSALCSLTVGGNQYTLRCCVRGSLVEANARLAQLSGQGLLGCLADEYIAILDLRPGELERLQREQQQHVHSSAVL